MGFTTRKNTESKPLFIIEPREKDAAGEKVDPFFKVRKLENNTATECENQKGVSATFRGIKVRSKTIPAAKGKPEINYEEIVVKLSDETANYNMSLRFRMDTRSLINSLLSAKVGETVTIEIYKSRGGYLSYSVKNGKDERIDWKFAKEEIPERDPVMVRGEVKSYDYTAIDDFFKNAIESTFGSENEGDAHESHEEKVEDKEEIPF